MFVIGTAGHVDHGKSLLVERLTGIDPDRLREEKARGMTIDLGFAWLTLPSGRAVSIVDVPGHERFIKNMLAGVGGIDLALLVVAADDGIMPQTREHLAILDLLGVSRGVIAVTKVDLVDDDWLALVADDVRELLNDTALAGSPIVPCSSVTGSGIDALVAAIDAGIESLPSKRDIGRPRLPIDRVFTMSGFGTVVTGTLIDGILRTGDDVEVVPGRLRGRIRGLQSHRDTVERAAPGSRVAINVAGIERTALRRGMVLGAPGALSASNAIDVRVRVVPAATHFLRHNMHVTFHCFADEASAQVRLLFSDELRPGEEGWAQIRLESPVAVLRGDRFVLRTPNETVAGGLIVDAHARRHRRGDTRLEQALDALLSDQPADVVYAAIAREPCLAVATLPAICALTPHQTAAAVEELQRNGAVIALGPGDARRVATADFVRDVHDRASTALTAFHEQHPLRVGMPLEELRSRLRLDGSSLSALLERWTDVKTTASTAAITEFSPALTVDQQRAANDLLAALRAAPYAPPALNGVDPALLAFLDENGALVDTGDGVVFAAEAFEEMRRVVENQIRERGSVTLAEARDALGTSRRYVQSLLEHLDRLRVTVRRGDGRVLR